MSKEIYSIGLMSGTSLDGVDLIYAKFIKINESYQFKIIATQTIPYSKLWLEKLKNAYFKTPGNLIDLDNDYGLYLAELILDFIKQYQIKKIDFIASHGHTIHHKPEKGYTLQIGNGQVIATKTQLKTIYDFRTQDVALGGQGAPLVPIGDQLLFKNYTYCLNLGGFANISFKENTQRIAYDICAVNTILNYFANKLGLDYDNHGAIAKSGIINTPLLTKLNKLPFYKAPFPKSLGIEYVNDTLLPLIESYKIPEKDILRTYTEHIAIQITKIFKINGEVLITGGGAFNLFLIERIKHHTKNSIIIPSKNIIDYKEALIFALLGLLRVENKINCLKSVTGAKKDHSAGKIINP